MCPASIFFFKKKNYLVLFVIGYFCYTDGIYQFYYIAL